MTWTQVPEPEGAQFQVIMPSAHRAWFQGTLVVPEDTLPGNRYAHAEQDIKHMSVDGLLTVCVDYAGYLSYRGEYGMYLDHRRKNVWGWVSSHFRNTLVNDPEFLALVRATTPDEMPPAIEQPYEPQPTQPPLFRARMTGPDTWEIVSPGKKTKHEKRMEARKGWRK